LTNDAKCTIMGEPRYEASPMAVNLGAKKPAPLKVVTKNVADLIEYENNPRKNDAAVPAMVDLINKFGFRQPILVKGDHVVDGHLRLKAARKIGMTSVPALDVGDMPDTEVRALRLAMNKSAEFADWDNAALAVEFDKLTEDGFELAFTGFEMGVVAKILKEASGDKGPNKTALADAGNEADPNYISLTFHMAAPSRTKVFKRLDKIMAENGLANRSQALLHLCKG